MIVIGSGATAVTLLPNLAKKAKHVTLLQRSPTYMVSLPNKNSQSECGGGQRNFESLLTRRL